MTPTLTPDVGDVLVVSTGNNWAAKLIRIGEVIRGQAGLNNHVAILHHQTDGVWWAIEGRPGGVGWVDARRYLRDAHTLTNAAEPKTPLQRVTVARDAEAMLGTPYDWAAICGDVFDSLRIRDIFRQDWDGQGSPGHVVCSSFAAYLYGRVGLAHPKSAERYTFPSDWTEFCLTQGWAA